MLQLLILLLMFMVTLGTTCPTMCTCRHYPRKTMPKSYLYYTVVKCQMIDANTTLDNSTRVLELSNLDEEGLNTLVQIMTESDLPYLNNLVLSTSVLDDFKDYFDVIGEQINYLSLTYNNLTSIPELSKNLSNLISLDLSNNKIESISLGASLRTLPNLEVLNLSANCLTQIRTESFKQVTNLKRLDLSRNNLSSLENGTFDTLGSLQHLNLSYNKIEVLSEESFSRLGLLQQLDVSWNMLTCVAPGSLQLPSLTRLLLAGNPGLGKSREVLVGVGGKLQSVDASKTGLKQVPAALTHSIRTLNLADNVIKSVNCGELDSYPLLQLLDFTSNNLVSIEEDALGRLESLSILYLTDNKIQEVPKSLPEDLTVLHIKFNRVEKIHKDDFEGMTKLEVLLVSDNKITVIEEGALRHLSSLATLDLSRNPITTLHPGSLSGPPALQVLRLAGIEAVSPAEDTSFPLTSPDHLITLDLSESPGLARQLLADNAALAASREVQELNLSGADLEFIRSDLLHFLTQLRVIHLRGNSLNCSELQWLAAWMRRQDEIEYRDVVCANPPDLWGIRILDLQITETVQMNDSKMSLLVTGMKSRNEDKSPKDNNANETGVKRERISKNITVESTKNKFNLDGLNRRNSSTPVELINEENSVIKDVITTTEFSQVKPDESGINQGGNEAISDTGSTEQSTNDRNYAENSPTKNSDEAAAARNKARASLNLILTPDILNNNPGSVAKSVNNDGTSSIDTNITESTSQWNGSSVEMSMYTNSERQARFLHPGMLILAAGILCGAATLTMLAARFNSRKKRDNENLFREDIEVASLPSVSELW
ncbi:protein artichoke-like [Sitophilus oryzae]|uniref:Protein artichoke-like n=1 Tax=Sitophilus oryzae TaxID=7048 RepID=A0A6J2XGS3_SITOR|nr:protein artichoke-like [Sitophilus oryzae]